MESQAYILILGVDVGSGGGFEIFAQIGQPAQSRGEEEKSSFKTLTAKGRNISEAVARLSREMAKKPDLSHLQLLLFSEAIAVRGVRDVLDFLRRDFSIRENIKVGVAADDIEGLLNIEGDLGSQPSLAIINQFLINSQSSSIVQAELKDFLGQLLEPDRQAILPMIESGEDKFTLGKTAVFDGYNLVETLSENETFGLLLWRDLVDKGAITVPLSAPDSVASFRIVGSRTKIIADWREDLLAVRVDITATLDAQEMVGVTESELKHRVQSYFVARLEDTLAVAQKKGVDFLGLAAIFRRRDQKRWQEVKDVWGQVINRAEFDLRCRVLIRGQGPVR